MVREIPQGVGRVVALQRLPIGTRQVADRAARDRRMATGC